jgi:short-subunit dehydrogenase
MTSFKGCTALITGASSGIGKELARQLAPHARCLLLVARRVELLEALSAEVARSGLRVHCIAADLADPNSVSELIAEIRATGESPTFLVNNAGLGDHGPFAESEWDRVDAMLEVNMKALTRLTHALLPRMLQMGRGAILNVGSIAGYLPVPGMAVYAASKAFVNSFSESLRAELRGTGVSVTVLCPGPVDTGFRQVASRDGSQQLLQSPQFFKVSVERVAREGLEAVALERARRVPGVLVSVAMGLLALVPLCVLREFLPRGGSGAGSQK